MRGDPEVRVRPATDAVREKIGQGRPLFLASTSWSSPGARRGYETLYRYGWTEAQARESVMEAWRRRVAQEQETDQSSKEAAT